MTVASTAALASPSAVRAPVSVESAVRTASARTGVDFSYLMEKAAVESGFRTDVKSSTSSATGLYQFIDSTWLATIKDSGARHGLGAYADAIETRSDGRPYVADPTLKKEILDLRKDPAVSALMAAEYTRANKEHLEKTVGGTIGSTELYLAHFLGPQGASRFLNAMKQDPLRTGQELFPEAAAANRNVFLNRTTGQPRSLQDIYNTFARKFDAAGYADTGTAVAKSTRTGGMSDGFQVQVPYWPQQTMPANALSIYQVLALNALETPDEADMTKPQTRDDPRRVRDEPVRTAQTTEGGLGLGLGLGRA